MLKVGATPRVPPIQLRLLGGLELSAARGQEVGHLLRQPKRLALLVYLVLATPRGYQRRDKLIALLWPELDQARARHSLRQALYVLRRDLNGTCITTRGDEEVLLNSDCLWCDVFAFEKAIVDKRDAEALELFRGDLLEGFHISEASPDFEEWLTEQRAHARQAAAEAAWRLSFESEAHASVNDARSWAKRAVQLQPFDEVGLRRAIEVFERAGDHAGALAAYSDFASRLANDLQLEPAPATRALIERLRSDSTRKR